MAPEHRFLDVQRPVGSADPDSELRETLERMGAEGWELAAVLPTDHVSTDSGGYVVSSMRLFFKQGAEQTQQIDEAVWERSGVRLPLPGEGHGALVVYCPPSWDGTTLTISGFAGLLSSRDEPLSPVIGRTTQRGTTHAAVFPNVPLELKSTATYGKIGLRVCSWPERVRKVLTHAKPEEEVTVYTGVVTEVDWTGKPPPEHPPLPPVQLKRRP